MAARYRGEVMIKKSLSMLDVHQYSDNALRFFSKQLFKTYSDDEEVLESIFLFFRMIVRENEGVKKIIAGMDEIDGIKAQKSKKKIEKTAETWLKKAYFQHLYNSYGIYVGYFTSFTKDIIRPKSEEGKEKLKRTSKHYFERYNDKYKKKLKRCRSNERVLELQKKYPKLNIVDAFAFGLIIEKFATTNEDLEWFENIVQILTKKRQ